MVLISLKALTDKPNETQQVFINDKHITSLQAAKFNNKDCCNVYLSDGSYITISDDEKKYLLARIARMEMGSDYK